MEKDGENYYRKLIKEYKDSGLKKIFAMLADEEVKHSTCIEQLRQKTGLAEVNDTLILENVKNIFVGMKEGKEIPQIDTS